MAKQPPLPKGKSKVRTVMKEFAQGKLKGGAGAHPKVKSRKQAIAIALSEQRKAEGKRTR